MNIKGSGRKRYLVVTLFLIILIFFFAGFSFASSGEEKATEWALTDTYRVMNFTVLVVGLFLLLRKPVAQGFKTRIKGIQEQLDELETKEREADELLASCNEKLSHLDGEAHKIIEEYVRQGNESKLRIIEEAKLAAEKLEEQAQRTVEYEFKRIRSKLLEDVFEKAIATAEKLIKSKIKPEDQYKLVDEYLEKVVAK